MAFLKTDLQQCCDDVNAALDHTIGHNIGTRYMASSRNGYTALDEYGFGANRSGVMRTLATGKPKECQVELYAHAFWQLHGEVRKVLKNVQKTLDKKSPA